jgi:hypothetical protein
MVGSVLQTSDHLSGRFSIEPAHGDFLLSQKTFLKRKTEKLRKNVQSLANLTY